MSCSRPFRLVTRAVLATLVAGLLVPLAAAPAYACSCVSESVSAQAKRADAVFVGTITERSSAATTTGGIWSSTDEVTYNVQVDEVYKGSVRATQQVVSVLSGASCGLEVELGRRYLLFPRADAADPMEPTPAPGQFVGSLCDGTTPATPQVLMELQTTLGHPQPPMPGGQGAVPQPWPGADVGSMLILGTLAWLFSFLG